MKIFKSAVYFLILCLFLQGFSLIASASEYESEIEPEPEPTGVEAFVERLYGSCLNRSSDEVGLNYWADLLFSRQKTAAELVSEFYNSIEYINSGASDADFVESLYFTMMNRSSDAEGLAFWLSYLNEGVSKDCIISGFVGSQEFLEICNQYGVDTGSVSLTEARDQNINTTRFVQRLYSTCLGRQADLNGLNYWCSLVNSGQRTAAQMVREFFESAEYVMNNKNDSDYIVDLYNTMMNRSADAEGMAYWVSVLNGGTNKTNVLKEFCESQEFTNICAEYGIVRGTIEIATEAEIRIKENVDNVLAVTGRDLKSAYDWLPANVTYLTMNSISVPDGYTIVQWRAIFAFEQRQGNCYCFAAAFYYLAKELGYDAHYVEGALKYNDGSVGAHGWVQITIDGADYYCDPELQHALKDYPYNFYMQPVGSTIYNYIVYSIS